MDPLTISMTFATIVGLICNFKSERISSSKDEYNDFIGWLETKNHNQQIEYIKNNRELSDGIRSLLNQNHEIVMSKLSAITETLILLSSKVSGFREISHSIAPNTELSSQAISILNQLEISGGSSFIETDNFDGLAYIIMETNGNIEYGEQRFVKDDLLQLVSLNLLTLDYDNQGNRLFQITRNCVRLLKEM